MITLKRSLFICILLAALVACQNGIGPGGTPIVIFPTATAIPPTFPAAATLPPGFPTQPPNPFATPTLPSVLEPNWNPIQPDFPGAAWRTFTFRNFQGASVGVVVVRIDPRLSTLRVHHLPGQARTIQQWQQLLPNALAIVNANYFDTNNRPLGLVVADGGFFGQIITRNDAGVFQVKDGVPRVRSLWLEPFRQGEQFQQAAQAFPMLMSYGYVAPINPDVAQVRAARTVIAQDKLGRILFIVTVYAGVTLGELANWLGNSGLNIDFALNMDGGSSTSLYIATGGPNQFIPSLKGVPVVVALYRR
ncbi:MAG: phosphodiester glycosidase family protein [Aggregatilineales bacterium]